MELRTDNRVCLIASADPSLRDRFGTGFLVHNDGTASYIVTCLHVISDLGGQDQVQILGQRVELVASGAEHGIDVAVLRLNALQEVRPFSLGDVVERGQQVSITGFYQFDDRATVALREVRGVIGAPVMLTQVGSRFRSMAWDISLDEQFVLRRGYSGAPVLDHAGSVIGMVTHQSNAGKTGVALSINVVELIWQRNLAQPSPSPTQVSDVGDVGVSGGGTDQNPGSAPPASLEPSVLLADGFATGTPGWFESSSVTARDELLRAALLMLVLERTQSGLWGKTYLYRRHVSSSGLPLALGSLTGTAVVITAIRSSLAADSAAFREWIQPRVSQTRASILAQDGMYLLGVRAGDSGSAAPYYEPLRHAAGGLITAMLLDLVGPRDAATLDLLNMAKYEDYGWTKAVVFRTLIHAAFFPFFSSHQRQIARARAIDLLRELIGSGQATVRSNQIWADPYQYGTDVKNQWMSLWAVLPALRIPGLPSELREEFESLLREFLLGQASATRGTGLLPIGIGPTGIPHGEHVFGTSVAVAAWRTLALASRHPRREDESNCKDLLSRLLDRMPDIIGLPAHHPAEHPTKLEGYFAWAGLCFAAVSAGARIHDHDLQRIVQVAHQLEKTADLKSYLRTSKFAALVNTSGLFTSSTVAVIVDAIDRLMDYYSVAREGAPEILSR